MSERIRHVTDETFEQDVLGSAGPALVDYWAEWCMPCRMIAPLLDDSAAHYGERLRIAKLDVDANPATASRYRVRSIPTLMLFRDGKVIDTKVGAVSKAELTAFIDAHLAA